MESFVDTQDEIEEAYLLLQDASEAVALDALTLRPAVGQGYKAFTFVAIGYLFLNLLSRRVPGPAHWLGLAEHVQLFHRIASLF